eukprot:355233-Chlamydomonas_euryale.AAC.1
MSPSPSQLSPGGQADRWSYPCGRVVVSLLCLLVLASVCRLFKRLRRGGGGAPSTGTGASRRVAVRGLRGRGVARFQQGRGVGGGRGSGGRSGCGSGCSGQDRLRRLAPAASSLIGGYAHSSYGGWVASRSKGWLLKAPDWITSRASASSLHRVWFLETRLLRGTPPSLRLIRHPRRGQEQRRRRGAQRAPSPEASLWRQPSGNLPIADPTAVGRRSARGSVAGWRFPDACLAPPARSRRKRPTARSARSLAGKRSAYKSFADGEGEATEPTAALPPLQRPTHATPRQPPAALRARGGPPSRHRARSCAAATLIFLRDRGSSAAPPLSCAAAVAAPRSRPGGRDTQRRAACAAQRQRAWRPPSSGGRGGVRRAHSRGTWCRRRQRAMRGTRCLWLLAPAARSGRASFPTRRARRRAGRGGATEAEEALEVRCLAVAGVEGVIWLPRMPCSSPRWHARAKGTIRRKGCNACGKCDAPAQAVACVQGVKQLSREECCQHVCHAPGKRTAVQGAMQAPRMPCNCQECHAAYRHAIKNGCSSPGCHAAPDAATQPPIVTHGQHACHAAAQGVMACMMAPCMALSGIDCLCACACIHTSAAKV